MSTTAKDSKQAKGKNKDTQTKKIKNTGGAKKKREAAAGTPGAGDAPRAKGDTSPEARDEVAAIPALERKALLEEKLSAEVAMKKEMAGARLGYAVVDLLKPGVELSFGVYNNRAQNKKAVGELVQAFRTMGIQHEEHPMPIAVKADWVEVESLVATADDAGLTAIRWTANAGGGTVTVLGGQHRRAAVLEYKSSLEKEAARLETGIATKKKKLTGTGTDVADAKGKGTKDASKATTLRADIAEMEDMLASTRDALEDLGKWTVEVYDIRKLQEPTLCHLSMNKIDPQLLETMTERSWRWVYSLKALTTQYATQYKVAKETLIPGTDVWSKRLLVQVIGDPKIRRKLHQFMVPFNHVSTWELMQLLSAFPYYTSEAVVSVKDLRLYVEEAQSYGHYAHMEVVRTGLETLHFIAGDFEWPAIDRTGKLTNPEESAIGPEVFAFWEASVEEAEERRALMEAQKKLEELVLPALAKTAATERQRAQKKFADLMGKVRGARVVSEVFPKELLEEIDAAYRSFLVDRLSFMTDPRPGWMDALRGYQNSIRLSCHRNWRPTLEKLRETAPDSEAICVLENAPQKLEWVHKLP